MSGASFGSIQCAIPNDQIANIDELKKFISSSEYETKPEITSDGINWNNNDDECAYGTVEEWIEPFITEAFEKDLITGTVKIYYSQSYVDSYSAGGSDTTIYIDKDGRIESPLKGGSDLWGVPKEKQIALFKEVNKMIADLKREALLAIEAAASA